MVSHHMIPLLGYIISANGLYPSYIDYQGCVSLYILLHTHVQSYCILGSIRLALQPVHSLIIITATLLS